MAQACERAFYELICVHNIHHPTLMVETL